VPQHSNDVRHRGGQQPTSRPRHLLAGLALPTAAAIVLMFIAAGTAVATTRPAALMQNAAAMSAQPAVVESAADRGIRLKALADAQAVAQTQSNAAALATAQAKTVAHAQVVARAKAVAHAQAAARAKVLAHKISVTRSNHRKALAKKAVTARAASAHSWRLPISHPVKSSGFGYRWGRLHAGEDFAVSTGTPLHSMSTGTVSFAGVQSGYGNIVQIRYWDGTISYFGHMSSISVHKGQAVKPGTLVGRSGNTGHSTGPHLHLEIHPHGGAAIDPLPWLAARHVAT
jgi:murein DD-endopeptidase MepM/ murein hydrolase activator NlpD